MHSRITGFALALTMTCLLDSVCGLGVDARTIHLKFPGDESYGQLFDNSKVDVAGGSRIEVTRQRLGSAKGSYKIDLPDKHQVVFEPNHRLYVHPEKLLEFSPEGIEVVKITFIPMEDRENNYAFNLCKNLHHLKYLQFVSCNGTEIGDREVAVLSPLPALKGLAVSRTNITGAVSKSITALPSLVALDMGQTALHGIDFAPMHTLNQLVILQLSCSNLTSADLKNVGVLKNLMELHLDSTRVDDSCIKYLIPLKKLSSLNISKTNITLTGLKQLKGAPLLAIHLPASFSNKADRAKLAAIFPLARLTYDKPDKIKSDAEMNAIFAPLH